MRQINLIKFLRAAFVVLIISVSAFTLNGCTGCNSTSKDDQVKDSTTTTKMSVDSSASRMNQADTIHNPGDTSTKGDQPLPPPK